MLNSAELLRWAPEVLRICSGGLRTAGAGMEQIRGAADLVEVNTVYSEIYQHSWRGKAIYAGLCKWQLFLKTMLCARCYFWKRRAGEIFVSVNTQLCVNVALVALSQFFFFCLQSAAQRATDFFKESKQQCGQWATNRCKPDHREHRLPQQATYEQKCCQLCAKEHKGISFVSSVQGFSKLSSSQGKDCTVKNVSNKKLYKLLFASLY